RQDGGRTPLAVDAVAPAVERDDLGDFVAVAVDADAVTTGFVATLVPVEGEIAHAELGYSAAGTGAGQLGETVGLEDRAVRTRHQLEHGCVAAGAAQVDPRVNGQPARQVRSGRKEDGTAGGTDRVDRVLDPGCVVGGTVADGAVVTHVDAGLTRRGGRQR